MRFVPVLLPIVVLTAHRNVVDGCIRSLSDITRVRVEEAYKMEQHAPTTRRDRHFLNYKNHYLEHYRVYYQSSLKGDGFFVQLANRTLHGHPTVSAIMGSFLEAGVPDLKETDLLKLAPYSEMEMALEIMAEVRAYYHSTSVPYMFAHHLTDGRAYSRDATLYRKDSHARRPLASPRVEGSNPPVPIKKATI